ncbi:MAG: hypothetical protein ABIT07_11215 [Ferruginibacter sp.]
MLDIKKNAANPLKIIKYGTHTDSSWLKMEDLQHEFSGFLNPIIDTGNLVSLFSEKKFLDQDLDAYTFTYDPMGKLPDTMPLLHWDVYVRPTDGKVTRIYMLKRIDALTRQQLTWQTGNWSKIITLKTSAGREVIQKEEMIIWNY